MATLLRQRLTAALSWLLFALAYYLPVLPLQGNTPPPDERVQLLLQQAMHTPSVQWDLLREVLTQLGLLAVYGMLLNALAGGLSRRFPRTLRPGICLALVMALGWVALMAANGCAFPSSNPAVFYTAVSTPLALGLSLGPLAIGTLVLAWDALTRLRRQGLPRRAWWTAGLTAGGLLMIGGLWHSGPATAQAAGGRNVILIGVDSLSEPLWRQEQQRLPTITRLIQQSQFYESAYTPLGRTFPAWVTILTGKVPAEHRALFNLRSLDGVVRDALLPQDLRQQGYRTVYGIDERRFNNIDTRFGFDALVGPKTGALDFTIQTFNDTPLTNFLLQTPLGHWLLPLSYINVASVNNYDAQGFVNRVLAATDGPQPLFLAVHFLSGHFPYTTRHAPWRYPGSRGFRARHVEGLAVADRQIAELLSGLKNSGRLDDALVVILSDHGEALGEPEPLQDLAGERVQHATYGHGMDLISDMQNHIVLGTLQFKGGRPVNMPQSQTSPLVSLLDLRPLVNAYVQSGAVPTIQPAAPCIPVETGLRLASTESYVGLDPQQVAAEGAGFYRLDPTGLMQLRDERLGDLIADKDVGLRCIDRLTIQLAKDRSYHTYSLSNGQGMPSETKVNDQDTLAIASYRGSLTKVGIAAKAISASAH